MAQEGRSSNSLSKFVTNPVVLGFVTVIGLPVAVIAILLAIYFYRDNSLDFEYQLSLLATQSAKQDIQISLSFEQNLLAAQRATVEVDRALLPTPPLPADNSDYAPTATYIAIQSGQIEATSQAIQTRQHEIEATQTSIAQVPPATGFSVSDANQVPLDENCNYQLTGIVIGEGRTGVNNNDVAYKLAQDGYIVGDAIKATIDGVSLGDDGVTFMIKLAEPHQRSELILRNGAFFIVAPEDAEGFLRLRVRNLECRKIFQELITYPPS